jgi:hypothetical protein
MLLVVEMLIAFVPLYVGWVILVLLGLLNLTVIGTPEFHWESLGLMVGMGVTGAIGGLGLDAMRVYLLYDRKRILSRRRMVVFCALGLIVLMAMATLSLSSMLSDSPNYLGLVYLVPLLCALHVLWLGRSYFAER